jgi:GT2 family glycosyltransferase
MSTLRGRISVIILTHNRERELRRTLQRMTSLPEQPEIIVVDNASIDATADMVGKEFPQVRLVRLQQNIGAAARNAGVQEAATPYVAFCDDDTWWAAGSLAKAVELLDAWPRVAVLSARVLVGEEGKEDPTCALMASSPLPADDLPGPALLGFLAGACAMRRQAFLDAGGYEPRFFIGGEEALLTLDLVAAGWRVAYAPELTVYHYPSAARDAPRRKRILLRNALWMAWMRLPWTSALRDTWRLCTNRENRQVLASALLSAVRGLPWVFRNRKVVPGDTAMLYRMLHQ